MRDSSLYGHPHHTPSHCNHLPSETCGFPKGCVSSTSWPALAWHSASSWYRHPCSALQGTALRSIQIPGVPLQSLPSELSDQELLACLLGKQYQDRGDELSLEGHRTGIL